MSYLFSRSMIKPDGVQRNVVGNIIGRFEAKGYQLKVAHSNNAYKPVDLQKSAKSDIAVWCHHLHVTPRCRFIRHRYSGYEEIMH
jgi:Nucleoside diphosphate kinase